MIYPTYGSSQIYFGSTNSTSLQLYTCLKCGQVFQLQVSCGSRSDEHLQHDKRSLLDYLTNCPR